MMTLIIEDFGFKAIVGILKDERLSPQEVIVDAKIDYEYNGHGFLDYMKVCKEIKKEFELKKFRLLEEAAISICETLKSKNKNILKISLQIKKPQVRADAKVGVAFEKSFC